jgi:dipeptidyl-peptidase-4
MFLSLKITFMKSHPVLFFNLLLICSIGYSQYFTINDIEFGRLSYLKPAEMQDLQWMGKSDSLCYIRNDSLFAFSITEQKEKVLIVLVEINAALEAQNTLSLSKFPTVNFLTQNTFYFKLDTSIVFFNLKSKIITLSSVPELTENSVVEPQTCSIAYTLGQNVFIQEAGKKRIQLTYDSVNGFSNGTVVYRHEFSMENGIFWSSAGNLLAYYRKNESKVGEYPLVNIQIQPAITQKIRYPMAGMPSEETEIWIYSILSKGSLKLEIPGKPDNYHTNLSWSPDEKYIYLQHLNRDQDTMILRCYSTLDGKLKKDLFKETDRKYVEPLYPLVFSNKHPENFLYLSERDGYNHIYYYEASSGKLTQLTRGEWEVTQLLGFDSSERYIYFMATKDSPLERHLYQYDWYEKTITNLTIVPGTHEVVMNYTGTLFIDTYSNTSIPRSTRIISNKGQIITELLNATDPLKNYILGDVTVGTIKAADRKTTLYYRLTKPIEFDPAKKYPVIIYVYGGPHVQLITNDWLDRIDYLHQYYAQHGIVSFELDSRGSDFRGRDFEDIIHRQLGIPQIEDQYEGVKFLEKLGWIDMNRIGIEGWSFGGYMTISMMLHYPDIFKVGVAGGPVTDWKLYEVMYGERYMDRPDQNPNGYHETNVNLLADKLQGKLLIIHGALDDVVVWQNSLEFLQECINQGKQVDYFVYPLEKHNVLGKERAHLTEMITQYFLNNL